MRIVPCACVATVTAIDVRSAGNAGQIPLSIFGICPPKSSSMQQALARGNANARVGDVELDAELAEGGHDGDEIVGLDVLDHDLSSGRRGEADEARDLDVVGPDSVLAPAELVHALDVQHVRADALDPRTERDEEPAEILDVRLAGGMAEHGFTVGENRRHDRVLGPHDRRLVEVDARAREAVRGEVVDPVELDLGAQGSERVNVCVETSPPDHVPSGRRHRDAPEAREQRPREEERRADLSREAGVEIGLGDPARIDPYLIGARPLGICAEIPQEVDHRLHVTDPGDVRQTHLVGGENGRSEDRQRAVLVAGRTDGSAERATSFDDEGLHRAGIVLGGPRAAS